MLAKKASVVKLCTRRGRGSVAAATTTAPPSSPAETAELGDSGAVVSAVGAGGPHASPFPSLAALTSL
jgi:hypothetical protein